MKLGYVILYVPDVLAAVAFYERAFGLKKRRMIEDQYAEMETGATALAFVHEEFVADFVAPFHRNRQSDRSAGIEVALVSTEVAAAYKTAIAAGALPILEPTQKPWGQIVSYVRDLNGCLVEICSPMDE